MLTCREITDSASDYIERNLPLRRRVSVKLHLLMCRHCRAFVDQLSVSINSLHSLEGEQAEPIPDETREQLLALFREHRDEFGAE